MNKKSPEKRKVGRPSKYKEEYCQMMIDYFSVEPTEMRLDTEVVESGEIGDHAEVIRKKSTTKEKGVQFPTFVRFALKIGVTDNTLQHWCKDNPEFLRAYDSCRELQEDCWKINSLNGTYNPTFAQFLGKNVYGYKDRTEVDQNVVITAMPTIQLNNGEPLLLEVGEEIEGSE